MVFTRPPTSKSSSPFNNPLCIVPKAPITIGMIGSFIFHSFFHFSSKVEVLLVLFCGQLGQQSQRFCKFSFFLLIIIRSGRKAQIRWYVCISKSQRSLCLSFSWTTAKLCIYHLFVWSNVNFLHISLWIPLPTHLCLILYTLFANFLYSLIIWLIITSMSTNSPHLLFSCVFYSPFDMIISYGVVSCCD